MLLLTPVWVSLRLAQSVLSATYPSLHDSTVLHMFITSLTPGADPYCIVKCGRSKATTPVKKDTLDPSFASKVTFFVKKPDTTFIVVQVCVIMCMWMCECGCVRVIGVWGVLVCHVYACVTVCDVHVHVCAEIWMRVYKNPLL